MEAAVAENDARLAAELLESARLQVEPTSTGGGRSSIGASHAVSVGGESRLASHYRTLPPVLALEEMITATGDTDAHWWGAWTTNERMYWLCAFTAAGVVGS